LDAVLLVIGYAIGTAQILVIDWQRRLREHRRQLRVVRAELVRTRDLTARFGWKKGVMPSSDAVPKAPRVSDQFTPTVAAIDFFLTDQHEGDNTHQAYLNLLDGLDVLEKYHCQVMSLIDAARDADDQSGKRELWERAVDNAQAYDDNVDAVALMLDSALEDIDRRIRNIGLRPQLLRIGRKLPKGENPPPLKRDDPRLAAFRERTLEADD